MNGLIMIWFTGILPMLLAAQQTAAPPPKPGVIEKGSFRFNYDERGLSGLANSHDPFGATLMPSGGRAGGRGQGSGPAVLGLNLSYRVGEGDWVNLSTRGAKWSASPDAGTVTHIRDEAGAPIKIIETFRTDGNVLDWTIDLESKGKLPARVGDLVFGWFAYGGTLTEKGNFLSVNPRDGLRRRLHVVIPDMYLPFPEDIRRLKVELERDGFAVDGMVTMDKALQKIVFTIENRTANNHRTGVRLSIPSHSRYELTQDGETVPLIQTGDWDYPWRAELFMTGPLSKIELVRTDRR